MDNLLDLYSDYLISSFGQTTATGLATLLDGEVSHDKITRFLAGKARTSADLWKIAKPHVRQIQSAEGVIILDAIPLVEPGNVVLKPFPIRCLPKLIAWTVTWSASFNPGRLRGV